MGANRSEGTVLVCKACVVRAGLTPSDLHPMSRAGQACRGCGEPMEGSSGQIVLVKDLAPRDLP